MNIFNLFRRAPRKGVTQTGPASVSNIKGRAATLLLRPYQQTGVDFLYRTKRAILADAPGLGKTLMATEATEHPTVISAPAHLADQWYDHITEQYPTEPVFMAAYGDPLSRKSEIENWVEHGGYLIVNPDTWRHTPIPLLAKTLIVDEFHYFRRRSAKRSQLLRAYAHNTPRVYGLTATPAHKDVGDLWHLLHILDPKSFGSYWRFINTYATTFDYGYGTQIRGRKGDLDGLLKPYVLERTYRQVGLQLPPRIEKQVTLRFQRAQQEKYRILKDHYNLERDNKTVRFYDPGTVLHELRKMTLTPEKISAVTQIVNEHKRTGPEPIIIFTHYKETARMFAELYDGICITGDISPTTRREYALTGGTSGAQVRAITQDSLDTGVDLSEARTVIYPEESYIPGQQYQTMTRVQRVRPLSTDNSPVNVYYVYYKQTVDEVIHRKVRSRAASALTVLREALAP